MSLAMVYSRGLDGLRAPAIRVEVHLANGLPSLTLVGLADTEVKEARERVRAALLNSGLEFPHNKRITVNLAPADLPKDSGRFDLPIAIGILAATGQIDARHLDTMEFAGELSLGGALRPIRGGLALALAMRHLQSGNARTLVLPEESACEAALVDDVSVVQAAHLLDIVRALRPPLGSKTQAQTSMQDEVEYQLTAPPRWQAQAAPIESIADLLDVKGQAGAKRALEVAAAGGHNLLMVGPPGTGKSMLARRFASLLPPMTQEEALESAAVFSLTGRFGPAQWRVRPFRAPHHTASAAALVGGGSPPRPGEISLAHQGILFLDELPEFKRVLDTLREPLETGVITISRAARQADFPAKFQLIAAMNPCPCGHAGSTLRQCRCRPEIVKRYQSRLSGPLLDRIDLQVEVTAVAPETMAHAPDGEPSAVVAQRVLAAREAQLKRQGCINADITARRLDEVAALDPQAKQFVQAACAQLGWTGRGYHRVLKLARTIADLAQTSSIDISHLAEAIQYRRVLGGI
jgi:magnesium chelatase family protein